MEPAEFKQQFPLLAQSDIVYLDNATVNPLPSAVSAEMTQFYEMLHHFPNKGIHDLTTEVTTIYNRASKQLAKFFNMSEMTYAFCPNTTIALANLLLSANLHDGDIVLIVANINHALLGPVIQLANKLHYVVQACSLDNAGQVDLAAFERSVQTQPVKLAIWSALPVLTGIPLNNQPVLSLAQENGVRTAVDVSRALTHWTTDFSPKTPDILLGNAWTGLYAPQGAAFMGIATSILSELQPAIVGDGNIVEATWTTVTPKPNVAGMEMGDLNGGAVAGLLAGMKFLNQYDLVESLGHERHLLEQLESAIRAIPACHILGPTDVPRGGLISFTVDGMDVHDVAMYLNELGHMIVRTGQMCAQPLIADLNAVNAVQVSLAPFISEEEVDVFSHRLKEIITEFA
ncbi:MAG TPA: aminotransferase class V-fold PLP-dependent enzyme [Candidatus Lokiarchaeia archaeon]|nr:aminotransferase class V-fold PLP-dependent enzyme [Candidatus Lokiarchaeia archaeon]